MAPGCLALWLSQELNGSVRYSGDALIAPTASQTEGRNPPPPGGGGLETAENGPRGNIDNTEEGTDF